MRQADIGIVAHPAMPVGAADAGRLDLDDDTVGLRRRIGHRPQFRPLAEFLEDHRAHRVFPPIVTSRKAIDRLSRKGIARCARQWRTSCNPAGQAF
jgi:hypothetical protein